MLQRPMVSQESGSTLASGRIDSRSARPRALHVINGRFFGGGQRFTLLLMDAMEEAAGADPTLCLLGDGGGLPLGRRRPIVVAFDGRYNNLRVLWSTARRLRRVVQEHDPDVVHTHGLDADLVGALAVRRCRAQHVSHLHIMPRSEERPSWRARVRQRLLPYLTWQRGTWFIAVSEAVRQQTAKYYRLPLNRIVTVRNGIDPREFGNDHARSDRPVGRLVIGAAGRLEAMKGFDNLIAAAGELRDRGIEFEVRIAGSGTKQSDLERQAHRLGIANRVRFVGLVHDMPAFYRAVDVFVLPSVSMEGLPLVVLEAMATGVPVVATRLAASEVIEDGINGLLVAPGSPGALAEAVSWLASDRERRRRMAKAGQVHVRDKFTIQRVAADVARLYQIALAH